MSIASESSELDELNKKLDESRQQIELLQAQLKETQIEVNVLNSSSRIAFTELERANEMLKLFIHPPLLHRVHIHSPDTFHDTEFVEESVSVMFADIRSYTQSAEKLTAKQVFNLLNQFFQLMEGPILNNSGFIDKFIGDEIMAVFSDPDSSPDKALIAGIEMQNTVKKLNKYHPEFFEGNEIRFGIGINSGNVMSGMLGTLKRCNFTVIGDHVNLASRLQELTKKYDADILISQNTYNRINVDEYLIREVDTVAIRGKKNLITVYEVFDSNSRELIEKKRDTEKLLKKTIKHYKAKEFQEALSSVYQWLDMFPEDIVAKEYLKRCRYFVKYPPQDPNWNSVVADSDHLIDIAIWRQEERFCVNTDVEIILDSLPEPLKGKLIDISFSGIKLGLHAALALEEIINTNFFLLDYSTSDEKPLKFELLCKSVWQRPGSEEYYELGAEIVKITPEQETQLIQVLQNYKTHPSLSRENHS